jgi:hypothetical protein
MVVGVQSKELVLQGDWALGIGHWGWVIGNGNPVTVRSIWFAMETVVIA